MKSSGKKKYIHSRDTIEVKTKDEVKNSKGVTNSQKLNNIKVFSQKNNNQNLRYSKNDQNDNENMNIKKSTNASAANHIIITSVDLNYDKLIKEDEEKIKELKDKIINERKTIEENKKKIEEMKKKNEIIQENITKNKTKLEKIKSNQETYEKLNDNISTKITEIKQFLEQNQGNILQQRQRQLELLRRREAMMNYLLSMIMNMRFTARNEDEYPNVDNMTYEELLALEERMGSVSKGLPEEKFNKLSREIYKKNKFLEDKCIICQYEFENAEKIVVLPCKHCFHPDCIEEWLKNQKVCPFCKVEIRI